MKLMNYKTGEEIREATINEAARSMTAGPEGVIDVDGLSCYVDGCSEAWAIILPDSPAWAIGTTEKQAWEQFRAKRDNMGIDPSQFGFQAVRITPESAVAVLDGDPDAWEAVDNA